MSPTPVLEQQVVARGAAHGPGDHAAVAWPRRAGGGRRSCRGPGRRRSRRPAGPGCGPAGGAGAGRSRRTRSARPPWLRAARNRGRSRPPRSGRPGWRGRSPPAVPHTRRRIGGHRHHQLLLGQDPRQPLGAPGRRGAEHHRVARARRGSATCAASLAPSPRIGSQPRDSTKGMSGPSAEGTRETTPAARRGQQPVEGDVQAGRVDAAARDPRWTPGRRPAPPPRREARRPDRGPGAARPAPPARPSPRRSVDQLLPVGQPREPRLHAVEELAVGQALPLVPAPGCGHRPARRPARRIGVVGDQLAAAEQLDRREVVDRALVGHVEAGQAVDLVAPEVDAHRFVGGRGEHVDDPAPDRQLPAVLDDRLTPVAHAPPARPTRSSTATGRPCAPRPVGPRFARGRAAGGPP